MYEISMTLNEPIEEVLVLQQGDSPILETTLFDWDGTAWDTGYDATLIIGRSTTDPDEWSIGSSVGVSPADNVFYFNLEEITYTRGIYWGYVFVNNDTETTPLTTPDDVEYSFRIFEIEVM